MTDAYSLYRMAIQLRDDTLGIINSGRAYHVSPSMNISLYNDMRTHLLQLFNKSSIVGNLPYIKESSYNSISYGNESGYIDVLSATGQIISFLEGVLDDPDKKIEALNNEIALLKEKKLKLEEVNKLNSENLNRYMKAEEFPVSEKIRSKIPPDILATLNDALCAYGAGSYTACVCVCRTIIQGLIQEQCAKYDIKENGLNKQIEALISNKKIKEKHNQDILKAVSILGNRSAHPTTEVFTKEKASLVLNGLLILIDEVFT